MTSACAPDDVLINASVQVGSSLRISPYVYEGVGSHLSFIIQYCLFTMSPPQKYWQMITPKFTQLKQKCNGVSPRIIQLKQKCADSPRIMQLKLNWTTGKKRTIAGLRRVSVSFKSPSKVDKEEPTSSSTLSSHSSSYCDL